MKSEELGCFTGWDHLPNCIWRRGIFGRMADAAHTLLFPNIAELVAFVNFITERRVVWTQ